MTTKDLYNPVGHYGYTEGDICTMYRGSSDPYNQIRIIASIIGYSNPNGDISIEGIKVVTDILNKYGYDTINISKIRKHHNNGKAKNKSA